MRRLLQVFSGLVWVVFVILYILLFFTVAPASLDTIDFTCILGLLVLVGRFFLLGFLALCS